MVLRNRDASGETSWKSFIIPGYIFLSAIFIVFAMYSYAKGMVYNVGLKNGFQQGSVQTIARLAQEAGKCNPIPVNYGEKTFEVVNVACLQQQSEAPQSQEVPLDEE